MPAFLLSSAKTDALVMRHYLYFREKPNADKAAQWCQGQGFSVETRRSRDGQSWLIVVKHAPPANTDEMDRLRGEMQALASQFDGEYDGWELAV